MFLPEIYMFLQRIHAAPRQAPSVLGTAPEAADPEETRHPARVLSDGDAPGRTSVDPRPAASPTSAAQPASEWDEWKSVRDVA